MRGIYEVAYVIARYLVVWLSDLGAKQTGGQTTLKSSQLPEPGYSDRAADATPARAFAWVPQESLSSMQALLVLDHQVPGDEIGG